MSLMLFLRMFLCDQSPGLRTMDEGQEANPAPVEDEAPLDYNCLAPLTEIEQVTCMHP
jgi:hypothetical protein